jgi:hypothetical protein
MNNIKKNLTLDSQEAYLKAISILEHGGRAKNERLSSWRAVLQFLPVFTWNVGGRGMKD